MSDLGSKMRHKRFNIKATDALRLVLETNTGTRFSPVILNCSLTGIGAQLPITHEGIDELQVGAIVPAAKITCEQQEVTLGRLIIRRVSKSDLAVYLGLSTIDSRVPIDGLLSRFVDGDLDSTNTPYDFELNPDKFSVRSFLETNQTNVDLFMRTKQFDFFCREWKESPKFGYDTVRTASMGERVNLKQFRRGNRNDYIVMGSNDYLGLASSPEVREAAKKAIDEYGFGPTGSPLATGNTDMHEELAELVAKTFQKQDAVLFNSGYTANVGTITGLTNAQDLIVADMLSHASILDAMQMSVATSRFFKHNDAAHLDKILGDIRSEHVGALVISEGIFSMDGDVAPLGQVANTARKYNARLMLDEAHSFGVIGPNGLGCWEKYPNVEVDIIMGTFSKTCGAIGGFVAADKAVIQWLKYFARARIFSVAIPPSTAAAALTGLKLFLARPELRAKLKANIQHFVVGLRDLGYAIDSGHESAVIPVVIGDEKKLGIMNEVFRDNGVWVTPITYPAVGRKDCRFRFGILANHSISDLDYVLNVLEKAMMKADFSFEQRLNSKPARKAA